MLLPLPSGGPLDCAPPPAVTAPPRAAPDVPPTRPTYLLALPPVFSIGQRLRLSASRAAWGEVPRLGGLELFPPRTEAAVARGRRVKVLRKIQEISFF